MPKLRVSCFAVSLDGYGAGPDQSLEHPLGIGGLGLHEWLFPTRTWQAAHGKKGGETGIDDEFAARGLSNIGARGYLAATCSDRFAELGPTTRGRGGGATIRPIGRTPSRRY